MDIKEEFLAQFSCTPPNGIPDEILENYHFVTLLTEKSSRRVYLLQHKNSGEKAILKFTAPNDLEDTAREYRILKSLDHPGIPKALAYDENEVGRFLLRTYSQGETLDFLLQRDGKFSEKRALEIVRSLCDILEYLHSRTPPVIFRDIQPSNIVLTPNGKLSLIDFGISKDEDKEGSILVGTRHFAAPENFGFSTPGPQTDIYALGCLLMWLCSGEKDVKLCRQLSLSGSLCRVIEKCTQLTPHKRYKNVGVLKKHLYRLLEPPKRWEISLSLGAAALIVLGGIWLWQDKLIAEEGSPLLQAPVQASQADYEKEASFSVSVQVLYDGEPCSDAVVALDNRHWYYPAQDGVAVLWGYAYDHYLLKACQGNRTAQQAISVNRTMASRTFELDLALTPLQPDCFELASIAGQTSTVVFPAEQVNSLTMQAEIPGIELQEQDGALLLVISPEAKEGHHSFFIEGSNSYGFAITQVSIFIDNENAPVYIHNAAGLQAVRENLGGSYVLLNPIDLSDCSSWEPIGTATQPFTGVFDGNGYEISGLSLHGSSTSVGLFGYAEHAVFRNVLLISPELTVTQNEYSNVGALAGVLQDCLLDSCAVIGGNIAAQIGNQSNVGGLSGYASGILRGCFSSIQITVSAPETGDGESYVGGLCGVLLGTITGSGNAGNVQGPYVVGGIVGMNDNSVISSSYNGGTVDGGIVIGSMSPGAISHIIRVGRYHSHCAYLSGTAVQATSVTTNGYPYAMSLLTEEEFQDTKRFTDCLNVDQGAFVWDSTYSPFPMPAGLFSK